MHFVEKGILNTKTVVEYTTELLIKRGLKNISGIQYLDGLIIYPVEYFCPFNYENKDLVITEFTYSIHHYSASWITPYMRLKLRISKILGKKITSFIVKMKRKLKE